MDEIVKACGFADAKEMHRMIANVDMTKPGVLAAFKVWQDDDGSKAGLAKLPVRNSGGG